MNRLKWPLVSALLAVLMAAGVVYAQVLPKNPVDWLIAKRITNSGTSTLSGAVTTGDDLTVGVDLAVTGNSDLTGDLTLAGALNLTPATVITVTQDMTTFAPANSFQPVAAASAVGFDQIGAPTSGNILILLNVGSQTITISETASIVMAGDQILQAGDAMMLGYANSKWYSIAPIADN